MKELIKAELKFIQFIYHVDNRRDTVKNNVFIFLSKNFIFYKVSGTKLGSGGSAHL